MITDIKIINKRKSLCKKIVDEHFEISLVSDRNANYLWWMYKAGSNQGMYRPFIINSELDLLEELKLINKDERESLNKMFSSEDEDNVYIALLSLESFRKKRIKLHGKFDSSKQDVSDEFRKYVTSYPSKLLLNYKK